MANQINICNKALAECQAQSIASIDEESNEANLCQIYFEDAIKELLEFHDWSWAIRTARLVKTDNDRIGEWRFSYVAPDQLAGIVRLFPFTEPDGDDTQTKESYSFPAAGPFNFPAIGVFGPIPYLHTDNIIFSNLEEARIEYTTYNISLGRVSALFAKALHLNLASQIVMPLRKDSTLKRELITQYEVERDRAIADDKNKNPKPQSQPLTDIDYARMGIAEHIAPLHDDGHW